MQCSSRAKNIVQPNQPLKYVSEAIYKGNCSNINITALQSEDDDHDDVLKILHSIFPLLPHLTSLSHTAMLCIKLSFSKIIAHTAIRDKKNPDNHEIKLLLSFPLIFHLAQQSALLSCAHSRRKNGESKRAIKWEERESLRVLLQHITFILTWISTDRPIVSESTLNIILCNNTHNTAHLLRHGTLLCSEGTTFDLH